MTDTTTIDETIADLITEATDLISRMEQFALRAHTITGPLSWDTLITEARWPGAGDKVTEDFHDEHPLYDQFHSMCWQLEALALAALSERSDLTHVGWIDDFNNENDDKLLADGKVKQDFKDTITNRRKRQERMNRHGRNLKDDPNYSKALTLAHQHINLRSTLDEFRVAAHEDGYSADTVDRVIEHLGLH